ncbi:MAG TPA: alpha-L-arabinofuranosidase C-terminal domain-containing protein, partial [Cyclobacteriaceae bacterium]
GAWWNRVCAFEMITDGADAMVTQPVNLKEPIETNRWYSVEIRVNKSSIECYLEGSLLMTYNEPARFFSIAGKDDKTGEVVIKVVNAAGKPTKAAIHLEGTNKVMSAGKTITLSANESTDENSFDAPLKFVPVEKTFNSVAPDFEYEFKPWSITILRVKEN